MTAPTPRFAWAGLAVRLVLTLAGAAGLIISAFMEWAPQRFGSLKAVNLNDRALFETTFRDSGSFVTTVGFAMIVLGLVAIIGLAFRSGWLTRLAGALGIAGFVLFLIEVYRADLTVSDIRAGAWIALAGAVVALVGGFLGSRPAATPVSTVQTVTP